MGFRRFQKVSEGFRRLNQKVLGFQKSTQRNKNCQKSMFADEQVPGHHPRALILFLENASECHATKYFERIFLISLCTHS